MLVTNRHLMKPDFSTALGDAIVACFEWVQPALIIQVRENDLPRDELFDHADVAEVWCAPEAICVVNSQIEIAHELNTGIHLPERDMEKIPAARQERSEDVLIGASVHSLQAAQRAQDEGANYLVFGSVFPTASHAGSTPKGIEALHKVASAVSIPVFAIGGISPDNCTRCLQAGAHGVAVMRAVWEADNVTVAVEKFITILND
jgi:thiamine-phosphate pyrophosphorylase